MKSAQIELACKSYLYGCVVYALLLTALNISQDSCDAESQCIENCAVATNRYRTKQNQLNYIICIVFIGSH